MWNRNISLLFARCQHYNDNGFCDKVAEHARALQFSILKWRRHLGEGLCCPSASRAYDDHCHYLELLPVLSCNASPDFSLQQGDCTHGHVIATPGQPAAHTALYALQTQLSAHLRELTPTNQTTRTRLPAHTQTTNAWTVPTAVHSKCLLELRSVTCHMGSYSVTCDPTRVNVHCRPGRLVLNLPTSEGWKAELTWLVGYVLRWFTCPQTVSHQSRC